MRMRIIRSTSTRGGQDVDFLMFVAVDMDADVYVQYLWLWMLMWMLRIMQICGPPLVFIEEF